MFIQYSNLSNVVTLPILQYSNLSRVLTLSLLEPSFLFRFGPLSHTSAIISKQVTLFLRNFTLHHSSASKLHYFSGIPSAQHFLASKLHHYSGIFVFAVFSKHITPFLRTFSVYLSCAFSANSLCDIFKPLPLAFFKQEITPSFFRKLDSACFCMFHCNSMIRGFDTPFYFELVLASIQTYNFDRFEF